MMFRLIILVLGHCFLLISCSDDSGGKLNIDAGEEKDIQIKAKFFVSRASEDFVTALSDKNCHDFLIEKLIITLKNNENDIVSEKEFLCSQGSGVIGSIPTGDNYSIIARGFDRHGIEIYSAQKNNINIEAKTENIGSLYIYLEGNVPSVVSAIHLSNQFKEPVNQSSVLRVGDTLNATFEFEHALNLPVMVANIRWFRGGRLITQGQDAHTYTLSERDRGQPITIGVTPATEDGKIGSPQGITIMTTPQLQSVIYSDTNFDRVIDFGDRLSMYFDQPIVLGSGTFDIFSFLVSGDSFGVGAQLSESDLPNQLTVSLGMSPSFSTRGIFEDFSLDENSPSGISVKEGLPIGVINTDFSSVVNASGNIDIVSGFAEFQQDIEVSSSVALNISDFNQDGLADLAVGSSQQFDRIYLGTMSGFNTENPYIFSQIKDTSAIVSGDMDNDGDHDVVVVYKDSPNCVYTNLTTQKGEIIFSDCHSLSVTSFSSHSVAVGDVNQDGQLDIAVANAGGQANHLYINRGDGTFDSPQLFGRGDSRDIVLADIDGDSDLDIVVANALEANEVYINDGQSSSRFVSSRKIGTDSFDTRAVAVADLNQDGKNDIVTANFDVGYRLSIVLSDDALSEEGEYEFVIQRRTDGKLFVRIFDEANDYKNYSADSIFTPDVMDLINAQIDGNNNLDELAFIRKLASELSHPLKTYHKIFFNQGSGVFTQAQSQSLLGENTQALEISDIDADGDLDILTANKDKPNQYYLNNRNGSFSMGLPISSNHLNSKDIAVYDLDRDGDKDVVVANQLQPIKYYQGSQISSELMLNLTERDLNLISGSTYDIALADMNRDGFLDVVEANSGDPAGEPIGSNQPSKILFYDPITMNLVDSGWNIPIQSTRGVVVGDLNNDNYPDLVFSNSDVSGLGGAINRIYFNEQGKGLRSFALGEDKRASYAAVLADMDVDGFMDIIISNSGSANQVYINNKTDGFLDPVDFGSNDNSYHIAVGDIDRDGYPDVVEINDSKPDRVYFNDQNGGLTRYILISDDTYSSSAVALADFNRDGWLDIVIANGFGTDNDNVHIFINDKGERFDYPDRNGQVFLAKAAVGLSVGDIDHDGDVDILVASHKAKDTETYIKNSILLNDGFGVFSDSYQPIWEAYGSHNIEVGDIDLNGKLDVITANDGKSATKLYFNK